MQDDTEPTEDIVKSKSQRKREVLALQELGEELVKLPNEQFKKITLPESLHDAVSAARHIHQHGARKRQLQYIGKLMRNLDPQPIQKQMDAIKGVSSQATKNLHIIERWRDRLLEEGDIALEELVQQHRQIDRQYLRQLLRNARKETLANTPPKSVRVLFRYLREFLNESKDD